MYYHTGKTIQEFFKKEQIETTVPPSFWLKAITAATQLGFGLASLTEDSITITTPNNEKVIYKGFKEDLQLHHLGIILTHAILTNKVH